MNTLSATELLHTLCDNATRYFHQGESQRALALYEEILLAVPDFTEALACRGTSHALLREHQSALQDLQRAIDLGCKDPAVFNCLGSVYYELDEIPRALYAFEQAEALAPRYPFTGYNKAKAYEKTQNYAAAAACLEKCLTLEDIDHDFRDTLRDRLATLKAKARQVV